MTPQEKFSKLFKQIATPETLIKPGVAHQFDGWSSDRYENGNWFATSSDGGYHRCIGRKEMMKAKPIKIIVPRPCNLPPDVERLRTVWTVTQGYNFREGTALIYTGITEKEFMELEIE